MDIAKGLRYVAFSQRSNLTLEDFEVMLKAAGALEDMEAKMKTERAERNAELDFLEQVCHAALHDLKEVSSKHNLCNCCKYLLPNGDCDSPYEDGHDCWVWRGVCPENTIEENEK